MEAAKKTTKVVVATLDLVGMNYRVTKQTRIYMRKWLDDNGPILSKLLPEPSNTHDPNAVKVVIDEGPYKGQFIGYISRKHTPVYGPRLLSGEIKVESAHITELWPDDGEGELLVKVRAPRKKSLLTALKEIT